MRRSALDKAHFDRLTKHWVTYVDRRAAGRALTVGILGLGLGALHSEETAARHHHKRRCAKARRCGKRCCRHGHICVDPIAGSCVIGRGTCAAGSNTCTDPMDLQCDDYPGCQCFLTTEGVTRCGTPDRSYKAVCGQCTSSEQCTQDYGPGAFCISDCGCGQPEIGFCGFPCVA